jgi:hypothetical protein
MKSLLAVSMIALTAFAAQEGGNITNDTKA